MRKKEKYRPVYKKGRFKWKGLTKEAQSVLGKREEKRCFGTKEFSHAGICKNCIYYKECEDTKNRIGRGLIKIPNGVE